MSSSQSVAKWTAVAGFGAWFAGTAVSQHPHRAFDRVRDFDPLGMAIPNWRFFAPEPAMHDYHLLHRSLLADGTETAWSETREITPRSWLQMVWFPSRRREKAVFDTITELIRLMAYPGLDLSTTVPFELLRNVCAKRVRADHPTAQGFQFLLARHTGHDESGEPDFILTSAYQQL